MRRTKFFGIGIVLTACVLALLLAVEIGFISIAWAKKPSEGEKLPWGVDRIDADMVWDPDDDLAVNPGTITGSGIKVAVVDTGIDKGHPDLDTSKGINFVGVGPSGNENYDDIGGHGTGIAGVIAAIDNEIGVIGVGPEIEVYAVRVREKSGIVYPDGYPNHGDTYNFTDLCEGMQWCVAGPDGTLDTGDEFIKVINFSLGTWTIKIAGGTAQRDHPLHDSEFYSWIKKADEQGIIMVGAAGNQERRIFEFDPKTYENGAYLSQDYVDTDDLYDFPASYPEVIAVSATAMKTTGKPSERGDSPASFTNYGPAIELSAPGASIYTTDLNGGYGTHSGTSLASPHVVGVAALVLARFANLTSTEVREKLTSTAEDLGDPGWDEFYGYGLVDAENAVKEPTHDVAVLAVNAPSPVYRGDTVQVDVDVANEGTYDETFDVVLTESPDGFTDTQTITLAAGTSTTVSFSWQTSTLTTLGDHTLTATAGPVTDETDTEDNSKSTTLTVNEPAAGVTVTSIDPNTMSAGTTIDVTIIGSGFVAGADVTFENGRGPAPKASNVVVVDANTITATVTAKSGGPPRNRVWDVRVTNPDGSSDVLPNGFTVEVPSAAPAILPVTALLQNNPSPANPETWMPFTLGKAEHVVISIYNATGRLVRTLDLGQKAPGAYLSKDKAAYWDGRNANGERVSSGIYFYLMEAGSFRATKKMVIVR